MITRAFNPFALIALLAAMLAACGTEPTFEKSERRLAAEAEIFEAHALLVAQADAEQIERPVVTQQAYRINKAYNEIAIQPRSDAERAAAEDMVAVAQATAALAYRAAHQDEFDEHFGRLITQGDAFIGEYLPEPPSSSND